MLAKVAFPPGFFDTMVIQEQPEYNNSIDSQESSKNVANGISCQ